MVPRGGRPMRTVMLGLLMLVGVSPLPASEEPNKTPREQFAALSKEYEAAYATWKKLYLRVDDPASPSLLRGRQEWPGWAFAPRFLELAKANPRDPVAVDALLWVVGLQRTGFTSYKPLFAFHKQALDILIRDHLQDERVVKTCL